MEKYFTKFPTIVYANTTSRNISRRVKIEPKDKNNPFNFYPFMLQDDIRSDQVAEFYFSDPTVDWLVYHTNNIVDPYYEWYQTNEVFESLIIEKYGSIEDAIKKIKYYRNNWATDDALLSVSRYQSGIPLSWRKYYQPVWGAKADILGYKRREIDYTMRTNRVLSYTISYISANTFQTDEVVDIKYGGEIVGGGQVEFANTTHLSIRSVSGNTIANSSVVVNLFGETSFSNATANAVTTVYETIPLTEEVFWSPVNYYDLAVEENEARKHINLVSDQLAPLIIREFEKKLSK